MAIRSHFAPHTTATEDEVRMGTGSLGESLMEKKS